MSKVDFNDWLIEEMNRRDWSQADLARRSGLSSAGLSRILSGRRGIGYDACVSISDALDLPIEIVLRKAGFLPEDGAPSHISDQIIAYKVAELPQHQKDQVLQFIEFLQDQNDRADRRTSFTDVKNREGQTPPDPIKE